eukprot:320561-Prymnesium_polylepis.1
MIRFERQSSRSADGGSRDFGTSRPPAVAAASHTVARGGVRSHQLPLTCSMLCDPNECPYHTHAPARICSH